MIYCIFCSMLMPKRNPIIHLLLVPDILTIYDFGVSATVYHCTDMFQFARDDLHGQLRRPALLKYGSEYSKQETSTLSQRRLSLHACAHTPVPTVVRCFSCKRMYPPESKRSVYIKTFIKWSLTVCNPVPSRLIEEKPVS